LLKPFSYEEFLKAAGKARRQVELEINSLPTVEANNQFLFLKSEYKIRRINFNDILYIEGLKDYIKIHLRTQKFPVVCRMTMKLIEEKLPSTEFQRIHKSFIVSLKKVESIRNQKIKIGENHIPLSDNYSEQFYQTIGYQKP
jgi:DNA-binding LytR/AlgR family response regulator